MSAAYHSGADVGPWRELSEFWRIADGIRYPMSAVG
jgi:hypothetical protein